MADPRFFTKASSFTLAELAKLTGSAIFGNNAATDGDISINDVSPLDTSGPDTISFFENVKYKEDFRTSKARACFVAPKSVDIAPEGMVLLVSPAPYKAYARAAAAFYPQDRPSPEISAQAHIHASAEIGKNCIIEAGAVIKDGAKIGAECWIESGAIIGRNVEVGMGTRIGPNATLTHCLVGEKVSIYPGVRIGQDGFGFAIDPSGHIKVPQLGRVIIEDFCEIGANTTIDRGAGPDTVIGKGSWIDNLVQIGHNVKIGRGCIIVSQVGISGSTELGDFVALGGQVGLAGHLKIGSGARIGAQAGVMRDIPPGEEMMGSPAIPIKQFMRQTVALGQLVKNKKTT